MCKYEKRQVRVRTFRSIDYICRIGGDEFAIIMVEMTTELKYTIEDKIEAINKELSHPTDGLPGVSLSVASPLQTVRIRERVSLRMRTRHCTM